MPKGNYSKKAYTKRPVVSKAVKKEVKYEIAKSLKQAQEMKWFGSGFAATGVYSGAGYQQQSMTLISRGTGDSDRSGDEIFIKSIHINIGLKGPVGSLDECQHIRCMVFQYRAQTTAATAPTVNEILLADVATGVRSTYSFRSPDFMSQYTVLYDRVFTCPESDETSFISDKHSQFHRIRVPLKYAAKRLHFRAANTDCDAAIWIAFIGSHPTAATNATCACEYRVLYTDS